MEQGRPRPRSRDLVESLRRSGDDAKRLFLLQKLEPLLKMLSDTVQLVEVERDLIGEREARSTVLANCSSTAGQHGDPIAAERPSSNGSDPPFTISAIPLKARATD